MKQMWVISYHLFMLYQNLQCFLHFFASFLLPFCCCLNCCCFCSSCCCCCCCCWCCCIYTNLRCFLQNCCCCRCWGLFGSKVWEKAISSQTNDGEHKKHKKGESKTLYSKTMMMLMMMITTTMTMTMLTMMMFFRITTFLNRRKRRTYQYFAWKGWNKIFCAEFEKG